MQKECSLGCAKRPGAFERAAASLLSPPGEPKCSFPISRSTWGAKARWSVAATFSHSCPVCVSATESVTPQAAHHAQQTVGGAASLRQVRWGVLAQPQLLQARTAGLRNCDRRE